MRKAFLISILFICTSALLFGISVSEILALSKKTETLFQARDEMVNLLLSNPSSPLILQAAQRVYSKVKILESAKASPVFQVAKTIVQENLNAFYASLGKPNVKTLPDEFDLVFNLLPISRDYSDFFNYVSNANYEEAVNLFSKLRFIYKIPNFENFLPRENLSMLWSFFAQGVEISPQVFDTNAAKFVAGISTPYDVRTLFMKTYVWLSGLNPSQSQNGIRTVEFETLVASFSHVSLDPNLLQWKYIVSKYISLYTSITNTTRQLSSAKELSPFVEYATDFYKASQYFPSQYRQQLSKILGTYLDLLLSRISTAKFNIPEKLANNMKKIASSDPQNPNSSKLIAIALSSKGENNTGKKISSVWRLNPWYYGILVLIGIAFSFFIPRIRLAVYRVFKFKKLELGFYMKKLSNSPEKFQWHMKIAEIYEKMGRYEEARREYAIAMKLMEIRR